MNIGLFSDTYTPQVNGVVTVLRALKSGLEKRGHKVYLFTVQHPKAIREKEEEEGVFRLPSFRFPTEHQLRVGMFLTKQIFDMVRPLKLDLIHSHTEFSLYLASRLISKKFKIPAIHTLHTYYPDYIHYVPPPGNIIMDRKLPAYIRHIMRSQKCVIVPSRKNADYLDNIRFTRPIRIIPNGIDLSHFSGTSEKERESSRIKIRQRYGIESDDDMIVFTGRMGPEKNIPVLIDNFKEIRSRRSKVKLFLVGDGPDRHSLQEHSHALGLGEAVIFSGYLRWPDEVKQAYAAADLFMSASHSEVHPISFIEAMASGLPIVAAKDSSIEDMVLDGENGWALEDDSVLWEKAIQILEDKSLHANMGARSSEISGRYTTDTFVDAMLACYEEYAITH